MKLFETHCHLDYLKQLPINEVVSKSNEVGIDKIITISVSPDNLSSAFSLTVQFDHVYCTQGIHPHEAKHVTDDVYETVKKNADSEKVVAIGEIGLDYHYNHSERKTQIKVFEEHLKISIEKDLPVVIHSREADEDMMAILNNFAPSMKRKGVIHSFTSTPELAEMAIAHGFYLGFNGIITFKKAQNVRDIVSLTPIDKILLETDAPFLTPTPHRGKENAPFYLPHVAKKLCEIKGVEPDQLLPQIYKNSLNLFYKIT